MIAAFALGVAAVVLRVLDDRQRRQGARLHRHRRLPAVAPAGPVHACAPGAWHDRQLERHGLRAACRHVWSAAVAALLLLAASLPRRALRLPARPARQVPVLGDRRGRHRPGLGPRRHARPRPGRLLRPRRLRDGHAPQAGDAGPGNLPDFMVLYGQLDAAAGVVGAVPQPGVRPAGDRAAARDRGRAPRLRWCSSAGCKGAYFAILSPGARGGAAPSCSVGQQGTTGGTNGLTDFQ